MSLFKRKEKKNPVEASMVLDKPEIKIVEARYKGKPFLVGIGLSKQQVKKIVAGGEALPPSLTGEYQTEMDLDWTLLYNMNNLPGFLPLEKAEEYMATTVSVVSGSLSVYEPKTKYKRTTDL